MHNEPKKSLGQNFLKDPRIVKRIIEAADLKSDDFVLEVGPGQGVLTSELSKRAKVIAIEKDKELAMKTADNFQFSIFNFQSIFDAPILNFKNNAIIIEGDILKINLPEIIACNMKPVARDNCTYKVIANIPYYITSAIIRLFLETKYPPKEMILMVQKEVAERVVAKPGKMSILSISVQYYADANLLFTVPRSAFYPQPKVDSAVIKISNIQHSLFNDHEQFFRTVKAGFCARRKTLANNLANSFHLDKKTVEEKIVSIGYKTTTRAQELSVEDWKKLAETMK